MVDNHCISAHLCCRKSIFWNSRVFLSLHPVPGRQTRRHITAWDSLWYAVFDKYTLHVGEISDELLRLMTTANLQSWSLVLSVESVWYIQVSQLQPVFQPNDSAFSSLLHKQKYQLREFGFPCTWQLWSLFERSTQGWLYGLRKAN